MSEEQTPQYHWMDPRSRSPVIAQPSGEGRFAAKAKKRGRRKTDELVFSIGITWLVLIWALVGGFMAAVAPFPFNVFSALLLPIGAYPVWLVWKSK